MSVGCLPDPQLVVNTTKIKKKRSKITTATEWKNEGEAGSPPEEKDGRLLARGWQSNAGAGPQGRKTQRKDENSDQEQIGISLEIVMKT